MKRYRIAILASGSGTNAENIIRYFGDHGEIEVAVLLSNNPTAGALERAARHGVQTKVFSREEFYDADSFERLISNFEITHLVLAGFLWLIPQHLLRSFPDRIINIHPALLPRFGGKGMYGNRVHQAVKEAGEKETGITIHLVNENYDEGRVLFQTSCPIEATHTAEEIARCVHTLEYKHYPPVIEGWILEKKITA